MHAQVLSFFDIILLPLMKYLRQVFPQVRLVGFDGFAGLPENTTGVPIAQVTKALRRVDIMFRSVRHAGEEAQESRSADHISPKEQ